MANYKITGTLKVIKDVRQVSDSFKVREFVITDNSGMYPQEILFQMTQDRCDLLNGFNVNDFVDVTFNIRGREWTNPQGEVRYFNSLDAWRIDRATPGATTGTVAPQQATAPQAPAAPSNTTFTEGLTEEKGDDDLPF